MSSFLTSSQENHPRTRTVKEWMTEISLQTSTEIKRRIRFYDEFIRSQAWENDDEFFDAMYFRRKCKEILARRYCTKKAGQPA